MKFNYNRFYFFDKKCFFCIVLELTKNTFLCVLYDVVSQIIFAKRIMRLYKLVFYTIFFAIISITFVALFGAIAFGYDSLMKNLFVSSIFVVFLAFVIFKYKNFVLMIEKSNQENSQNSVYCSRAVVYETISNIVLLICLVLIFTGVYHRVFIEQMPVLD